MGTACVGGGVWTVGGVGGIGTGRRAGRGLVFVLWWERVGKCGRGISMISSGELLEQVPLCTLSTPVYLFLTLSREKQGFGLCSPSSAFLRLHFYPTRFLT